MVSIDQKAATYSPDKYGEGGTEYPSALFVSLMYPFFFFCHVFLVL